MGIYIFKCSHKERRKLAQGVSKCINCGRLIITDMGVAHKVNEDWESK